MAFQQGLSGLNAASKALDVTSNNVANSGTVGYKSGQAHFADVYANALNGSGTSQTGIGTTTTAIQQQFTQGNITTTSNSLDISINGSGFYRMDTNGTITYSRAGQFHLDKEGYVIDDQSRKLTGYVADSEGNIVKAAPQDLLLSSANQPPAATGASGSADQGVFANINFDSRATVPTGTFDTTTAATANKSNTYNFSTATTIYDTLGNAHTLTFYLAKSTPVAPAASTWNVYASVDGTKTDNSGLSPTSVSFDSSGKMLGTGILSASINLGTVMTDQGLTNIAGSPLAFDIDLSDSSQFGSAFGTNSLTQDGYTSGRLTGVSVSDDGIISGNYSNGKTRNLGQVALAAFTNPNGLASLGGNQWAETDASGAALVGTPNSGTLGVLTSSTIEESNVDLTAELVNMITQQRAYQASAQTIKTQDQIMQTLVNLR